MTLASSSEVKNRLLNLNERLMVISSLSAEALDVLNQTIDQMQNRLVEEMHERCDISDAMNARRDYELHFLDPRALKVVAAFLRTPPPNEGVDWFVFLRKDRTQAYITTIDISSDAPFAPYTDFASIKGERLQRFLVFFQDFFLEFHESVF